VRLVDLAKTHRAHLGASHKFEVPCCHNLQLEIVVAVVAVAALIRSVCLFLTQDLATMMKTFVLSPLLSLFFLQASSTNADGPMNMMKQMMSMATASPTRAPASACPADSNDLIGTACTPAGLTCSYNQVCYQLVNPETNQCLDDKCKCIYTTECICDGALGWQCMSPTMPIGAVPCNDPRCAPS
jgi:hypothetical protein